LSVVVDTSFLVDVLREHPSAVALLRDLIGEREELVSSTVVRTEVLAGVRGREEERTLALLSLIAWEPVTQDAADRAGMLGRRHLPANPGIDTPDLLIAEVALRHEARLLTTNVKHFKSLVPGVRAPY
jgi:predicted nucleic acid-binding protein